MADKEQKTFRTRRTPAEMELARGVAAKNTPPDGTAEDTVVSDELIAEMKARAKKAAQEREAAAKAEAEKFAANISPKKWLYNSNIENISEFHEDFLVLDDGFFEYTPPSNFPFSDDDKETHLEFCRARVNTKPIDGVANAKRVRTAAEQLISQTEYMPPQPTQARDDALMVVTEV